MTRHAYLTVAEAEDFLSQSNGQEAWLALSDEQKQNSLYDASQLLDNLYIWKGQKLDQFQPLSWPRKNVYDCDGFKVDESTIPSEIINATILIASNNATAATPLFYNQSNVTKVKVGPIDVSMDVSKLSSEVIPSIVQASLRCLGEYNGPRDGSTAYNVSALR